VLNHKFTA